MANLLHSRNNVPSRNLLGKASRSPDIAMAKCSVPILPERAETALVSVIIPTYNRVELLGEAVQSCLDQTWPSIEVIIVDDGSTDGTDAFVAERLAGPWSGRVQYYKQENAGASAARNRGLELARGEYVQFLDSDDLLFKDKIALQVRQIEAVGEPTKPEGCSCYGRIGPLTKDLSETRRIGIKCATPQEYIREMCTVIVAGMCTNAPLWLRPFLIGQPGWRTDINLGDDLEYYLRLLSKARKMAFVEKDLFWIRAHDGGRLSNARKNRPRMLSAIRAHQAVVETVRTAGMWDTSMQTGILRIARRLYANALDCGKSKDIRTYEEWVLQLTREPRCTSVLPLLIICRRVLGPHAILLAHRLLLRLRKRIWFISRRVEEFLRREKRGAC
jgi:hypothetical protein